MLSSFTANKLNGFYMRETLRATKDEGNTRLTLTWIFENVNLIHKELFLQMVSLFFIYSKKIIFEWVRNSWYFISLYFKLPKILKWFKIKPKSIIIMLVKLIWFKVFWTRATFLYQYFHVCVRKMMMSPNVVACSFFCQMNILIVKEIMHQFKFNITSKVMWKLIWRNSKRFIQSFTKMFS